jgi:two-component system, OmpR family, alkaline phosphatase synthesis response regulator PhoP
MALMRLLVASPYAHFLTELLPSLTNEFEIQRANSEDVLSFLVREWSPHLVLIDGDSVLFNSCDRVRSRAPFENMALVLLTKEVTASREERAIRAGCDQVLGFPQSRDTFCLRIKTLARRLAVAGGDAKNGAGSRKLIDFGELKIFPDDHLIRRGEQVVTMTPIQFKLLLLFLHNRDQLLSRQHIKDSIWEKTEISLRSIDAQISKLRKIIPELDPHLVNIYGKGYVLTEGRREAA